MTLRISAALAILVTSAAGAQTSFDVPLRPPVFRLESGTTSVELRGVTFYAGHRSDGSLAFGENEPFPVEVQWMRTADPAPLPSSVQFRIEGAGPSLVRKFPVEASDWRVGSVHSETYEVSFPRLRYSGKGTIYIDAIGGGSSGSAVLWAHPVMFEARLFPSELPVEAIRERFGAAAFPLRRAFRLGPGASVELPVPQIARIETQLLGIVSSTNYDNETRTGETVAVLEVLDAAGEVLTSTPIRSGITTAKRDHDEYAPGFLRTRKVNVVHSVTAERPSRDTGEPYEVHDYGAILPLDDAVMPVSVRIRYLRDYGILHVSDIVVYPRGRFGS